MNKKKIIKFIPISAMAATLVFATIPFSYISQNNNLAQKSTPDQFLAKDAVSFDAKNLKLNSTWANDVWDETEGFYYTPPSINTLSWWDWYPDRSDMSFRPRKSGWLFKLDESGFSVNPNNDKYDNITIAQNCRYEKNSSLWGVELNPINVNLTSYYDDATKVYSPNNFSLDYFDYSNQTFEKKSTTTAMKFGSSTSIPFKMSDGASQIGIDQASPYVKFTAPAYYYHVETFYYDAPTMGMNRIDSKSPIFGENQSYTSVKKFKESNNDLDSYEWGYSLPGGKYRTYENSYSYYEDDKGSVFRVTAVMWYTLTNISMYKDFDGLTYKDTHMTKHGFSFNSSFDELIIDETAINKNYMPSTQVSKLQSATTIVGNDIGYNFVRDGNFVVTPNDAVGEIKVSFTPKNSFVNGEIIPYTGPAIEKTITGLVVDNTKIVKLAGHPNNVIVDKWKITVANDQGLVTDRNELSKYLDLRTVPSTAQLYLVFDADLNKVYNYKTGTVSFGIYTSQIFSNDGKILDIQSEVFPITLTLAPRVTKFIPKTSYPADSFASELKTKLIKKDSWLVKDVSELQKYVTMTAPVDGANYYLVDNLWDSNPADGTVKFSIYADKYYDANGVEKTGSGTTTPSKVSLSLQLKRLPSNIAIKPNYPTTLRVDKFVSAIQSNGTSVNRSELEKYLSLDNIPSNAVLSIQKPVLSDFVNYTRKDIKFDLKTTHYNNAAGNVETNNIQTFILTLGEQHQPTKIVPKSIYDQHTRADIVVKQLNILTGQSLVNYLSNFLTFESMPKGSSISLQNVKSVNDTGMVTFDIVPTKIYNATSDLVTPTNEQFKIALQFGIKYKPTTVKLAQYPENTAIAEFNKNITSLTEQSLYDYLVPKFLVADGVNPKTMTTEVLSLDLAKGKISFKLLLSSYYDENFNLVNVPISYTFELSLLPKYNETKINTWDAKYYPTDLTVDNFRDKIEQSAVFDNGVYKLSLASITLLNNYVDLSSVPPKTAFSLTWDDSITNAENGVVGFNLITNQYYNNDGLFIDTAEKTFNIKLNIAKPNTIPKKTILTTNPNSPIIPSKEEFLEMIYNSTGMINRNKLSIFVAGLQTIPSTAQITNIDLQDSRGSAAICGIEISGYYDGIKNEMISESKTYEFQVKIKNDTSISSAQENTSDWWIWVIVAGAGSAVALAIILAYLKYRKNKKPL